MDKREAGNWKLEICGERNLFRFFKTAFKVFLAVFFISVSLCAQDIPPPSNPPRLVNDFENILSESEKNSLEQKLVAFNDSTSSQIAIVILKTTGDYPVDDYTIALYRKWGIGQNEKDNGVVILCAMADRKIAIITGYGLEGALPDAICKRIVEQKIKPNFKEENYFGGLDAATDEIIKRASGEYVADEKPAENGSPLPVIFIVAIIFLLIWVSRYRSVKRYAALNSIDFWTAWALLNAARGSSRSSGGWGGGSGWSSGGGGGFGGFGGGSTGGGGATGSW